jgi:hypothetical protein
MSSYIHLGMRFEVWNYGGAWFWLVVNPGRNTGVIGAAAKESDAELEARSSIDAMSQNIETTSSNPAGAESC